ncbi:MAG: sugar phosphate isomerase/epimerase [Bacteroidales bacterium]|nr:sugar phosphate isomerase/epimerase [Bacteroidales bacterium]
MTSRRSFLKQSTAVTLGLIGAGCRSPQKKATKTMPVGLQLYSVREECKKDFPGTIAKVAQMGYDGVEFAGYYDYSAKDVRKMMDDNGLVCCGSHVGMNLLTDEKIAETIEYNAILGNQYLIVPWLKPNGDNPLDQWRGYADRLTVIAEKLKPHNMKTGYHCHAHDYHAIEGQIPWEIIFDNTPAEVVHQMDTCNCSAGDADPVAYLKKYPNRSQTVHLKEWSATKKDSLIGEGDVAWQEVFAVCESTGGTEWYIIEEEKDAYPPLEAVELCLKYYRQLRG